MTDAKGIDSEMPCVPILRISYFKNFKLTFYSTVYEVSLHYILLCILYKFHVIAHERFHRYF